MTCGIFGANGSGKSSLLDAVQTVMLGGNESHGDAGVAYNAQADEGNHNSRSIRAYCLGQYGHAAEARVRDNADTYITLIWEDSQTRERYPAASTSTPKRHSHAPTYRGATYTPANSPSLTTLTTAAAKRGRKAGNNSGKC